MDGYLTSVSLDNIVNEVGHSSSIDINVAIDPCVDAFFRPQSVAIVGATERAGIGRVITTNLKESGLTAKVWAINPSRTTVLGLPCFPAVDKCPSPPDLVIIITPSHTVPPIVGICVDIKVKSIVVISSGFKEIGPKGQELEDQIAAHLRRGGNYTRVVGPNCFGTMCPGFHLNSTFGNRICRTGSVALASQSGALMSVTLDWALQQNIGFSKLLSVGSMVDLDWAGIITYFGNDPDTKAIGLYMESIGNPGTFLAAAREVALRKPIFVLKTGRSAVAAKAALSHTGSLAGSDDVLDAALHRAGVIRINSTTELQDMIMTLSFSKLPKGPNMVILTHAGGPGVLAADALSQAGGELVVLPEKVLKELDPAMPKHWSMGNPMDITGGASPEQYEKCMDAIGPLPDVHSVIVLIGPLTGICALSPVCQAVRNLANDSDKTVIMGLLGGDEVYAAEKMLLVNGVSVFHHADNAAKTITEIWNFRKHLTELYKIPKVLPSTYDPVSAKSKVDNLLEEVRKLGRTILTEDESKQVLACYGIPVCQTLPARSADEAANLAVKMGFPVVVKLLSETVTHKSDVGGVILNLNSEAEVRLAFETIKVNLSKHFQDWEKRFDGVTVQPMLNIADGQEVLLGGNTDVQLGPVVVFGMGGKLVEIVRDRALGLPPMNSNQAQMLIQNTKVYKALQGARGSKPVDMEKLTSIVMSFGDLLVRHPLIKECDINPLFASSQTIMAVDARIVVWPKDHDINRVPKPAICPFPIHLIKNIVMKSGPKATIRLLRPEDCDSWVHWQESLPYEEKSLEERISKTRLIRILFADPSESFSVCAFREDGCILGGTRVVKSVKTSASLTVTVPKEELTGENADLFKQLIEQTVVTASSFGFHIITSSVKMSTAQSEAIIQLLMQCGFSLLAAQKFGNIKVMQLKI